jgi:predicted Zn-dependent protease
MAAVISHELSHQIAHHSAETIAKARVGLLAQVIATSIFYDFRFLFRPMLDLVFLKPNSRAMETEVP